jgi:hypothetical protein
MKNESLVGVGAADAMRDGGRDRGVDCARISQATEVLLSLDLEGQHKAAGHDRDDSGTP